MTVAAWSWRTAPHRTAPVATADVDLIVSHLTR